MWGQQNDNNQDPVDHEMCVRVFGAASSPCCSNYALKQTAANFVDQFGIEAAEILEKNFYVDDLLKSVREQQVAIEVINKSRAGGVNILKLFHYFRKFFGWQK